jgi:hypothetical protein
VVTAIAVLRRPRWNEPLSSCSVHRSEQLRLRRLLEGHERQADVVVAEAKGGQRGFDGDGVRLDKERLREGKEVPVELCGAQKVAWG